MHNRSHRQSIISFSFIGYYLIRASVTSCIVHSNLRFRFNSRWLCKHNGEPKFAIVICTLWFYSNQSLLALFFGSCQLRCQFSTFVLPCLSADSLKQAFLSNCSATLCTLGCFDGPLSFFSPYGLISGKHSMFTLIQPHWVRILFCSACLASFWEPQISLPVSLWFFAH